MELPLTERLPWGVAVIDGGRLSAWNTRLLKDLGLKEIDLLVSGANVEVWLTLAAPNRPKIVHLSDGAGVRVPFTVLGAKCIGERVIVLLKNRAEDELRAAFVTAQQERFELASRYSLLGEMAASIAHEIANPLALICGLAEQLGETAPVPNSDNVPIQKMARKIEETTTRVSHIIKGLNAIARDGDLDPFQRAPLKGLIHDALDLCRERLTNHGVRMEAGNCPEALELECRGVQMTQMVLNLVNNAYDAIATTPDPWIRIEVCDRGDHVLVSVIDSGHGIAPDIRAKILTPFFTTKGGERGAGLGLAITNRIIMQHSGSLSIDAASPHTRFDVRLPKRQPIGRSARLGNVA